MKTAIISKRTKVLKVGLQVLFFLLFTGIALSITYLSFNLKKDSLTTKTFWAFFVSKLQTLLLGLFVTFFVFRICWTIIFTFLKNHFLSDWMSSKPYPRHYKWFTMWKKEETSVSMPIANNLEFEKLLKENVKETFALDKKEEVKLSNDKESNNTFDLSNFLDKEPNSPDVVTPQEESQDINLSNLPKQDEDFPLG